MKEDAKKIGLTSLVLLGINSMVGSGIFLLPGQVMALVGLWGIAVYALVTLIVLAIAWCFAQCAALFHRNGGAYVYAKEAFGEFIGFEIGIMRWAVGMIAWASLVVAFVTALGSIWPPAMEQPFRSIFIISFIAGLGAMNVLGVKMMRRLNDIITIAKLIPLLFFVGIGVFYIQESNFVSAAPPEFAIDSFGAASLVIFYAFGGFESLAVAAQDMRNPTKNVPIAVMIVVIVTSILYFLIQLIAIGTLGPNLASSQTPIADVAELLFGGYAKWLVMLATLISIGGVNIASSFITPRSGVALAEDNLIPKIIAHKGKFGTPVLAIVISVTLTSLVALSGDFTQLATISVVSRFAQYLSTCLAIMVFRRRSSLANGYSFYSLKMAIPILALGGIGWLILQATSYQLYWGLGGLILGVPLYFFQKKQSGSYSEMATTRQRSNSLL